LKLHPKGGGGFIWFTPFVKENMEVWEVVVMGHRLEEIFETKYANNS